VVLLLLRSRPENASLIDLHCGPFGIVELVRTGPNRMVRSVDRSNNSTTGRPKKIRRRRVITYSESLNHRDTEFTERNDQ